MTDAKEVSLKDVIVFLHSRERTIEDYRQVAAAFKAGQRMSVQRDKFQFRPGMMVKWTSTKTTNTYQGTVVKLGRSMVHVRVGHVVWRVSPGLLTSV